MTNKQFNRVSPSLIISHPPETKIGEHEEVGMGH